MEKARVFIGSSSEVLAVAEAVFSAISRDAEATLWTNEVFSPGSYPLEALDDAIRRHTFAILVASPDDQVVKGEVAGVTMRDNVMLEFGLFVGAFGRRRVLAKARASEQSQAILRLNNVAARLRDTLIVLQRDSVAALSDAADFEALKAAATGVRKKAIDYGVDALNVFLGDGDPERHVRDRAESELGNRFSTLVQRYTMWWDRHSTVLQDATAKLQDALFDAIVKVSAAHMSLVSAV